MKYFYLAITAWLLVLLQSVLVYELPYWLVPNLILLVIFWFALRGSFAESLIFALLCGIFIVYFVPEYFFAPAIFAVFAVSIAALNQRFSLTSHIGPSVLIFGLLSVPVYLISLPIFHFPVSVWLFLSWLITVVLMLGILSFSKSDG